MKIREFEVVGLARHKSKINGSFAPDLNILTGRNGAGKTTVLKLLWYIISGNILDALREVDFKSARIVTDEYVCTVIRTGRLSCKVELETAEGRQIFEDEDDDEGPSRRSAEDFANPILISRGSSLFFPTFRRLEGGFSLTKSPILFRWAAPNKTDIEEALTALSRRMSNDPHNFIAAISTGDIVNVILQKFGELSSLSNDYQQAAGESIISEIRAYKADTAADNEAEIRNANILIDEIKSKIEVIEESRKRIMLPIEAIRNQVKSLFKHSGISLDAKFTFGDAANAINSDSLSAGEKQMLSFISYNAFYEDSIIIIDEPELSLHVDWQRQLFPILLNQQSSNQFIIATHSPFIYGKFPEKELVIDPDKGDASR